MANITRLDELKKITLISEKQWSITRILNQNDFNLVTNINYESLFDM